MHCRFVLYTVVLINVLMFHVKSSIQLLYAINHSFNSITPTASPMKFLQLTQPETMFKLCKFCENRARDTPMRGVYIPHFDQISVSVLGVLYIYRCTDGGLIWHRGDLRSILHANFYPVGATCRPCGAKKLKIGLQVI